MSYQILKKKKKKKQGSFLYIDFSCLDKDQTRKGYEDIKDRIKTLFRQHIGVENSISPHEVFYSVYGINPQEISIFEREFWWNVIKGIMRELRKSESCFIINRRTKLFVLKSDEELDAYKKTINRHIKDLGTVKKKAIRWVAKKSWKKL